MKRPKDHSTPKARRHKPREQQHKTEVDVNRHPSRRNRKAYPEQTRSGVPQTSRALFPSRAPDALRLTDAPWQSIQDLSLAVSTSTQALNSKVKALHVQSNDYLDQSKAVFDLVAAKLNSVITAIDEECFSGNESELVIRDADQTPRLRGGGWSTGTRQLFSRGANRSISTVITNTNHFAKVNLYANSRLPQNLPPLRVYLPAYPLLCLAAQYSHRVYDKPSGAEREAHVPADSRLGTKAMVIKSVPLEDMNTVVFAIRGSQTFMDWAVNLDYAPTPPTGFLDDPGNLCHSGFLSVARKMVAPVAARLRSLLEENPSRASFSLLITGHSAGGAVASLLYAHMQSEIVNSELTFLTGCFKRVHCITFGAPPLSLLPLYKPSPSTTPPLRKSLFLSFINEGDPVPRANKAYVLSLLNLYSTPSPIPTKLSSSSGPLAILPTTTNIPFLGRRRRPPKQKILPPPQPPTSLPVPIWPVPPATLSNAGRLVVLRGMRLRADQDERVQACVTSDEQLRGVVFGDPMMHMMKLYARRIDTLATQAVLGRS
ncbi:MAG: hypothetical protein M1825_001523 [Sarcosagium campestre]|nr:MAG: hypothetical protein M1825_001523 [Sarcosagium campestre]